MIEAVPFARQRLVPVELFLGVDGEQEALAEGGLEPGEGRTRRRIGYRSHRPPVPFDVSRRCPACRAYGWRGGGSRPAAPAASGPRAARASRRRSCASARASRKVKPVPNMPAEIARGWAGRGGRERIAVPGQPGRQVGVERHARAVAGKRDVDDLARGERAGERREQPPGELHRVGLAHADRERRAVRDQLDPRAARAQHAFEPAQGAARPRRASRTRRRRARSAPVSSRAMRSISSKPAISRAASTATAAASARYSLGALPNICCWISSAKPWIALTGVRSSWSSWRIRSAAPSACCVSCDRAPGPGGACGLGIRRTGRSRARTPAPHRRAIRRRSRAGPPAMARAPRKGWRRAIVRAPGLVERGDGAGPRRAERQPDRERRHRRIGPADHAQRIGREVERPAATRELGVERARLLERQARRGAAFAAGALERLDPPHERADAGFGFGLRRPRARLRSAGSGNSAPGKSGSGRTRSLTPSRSSTWRTLNGRSRRWRRKPRAVIGRRGIRYSQSLSVELRGRHRRGGGLRLAARQPGDQRAVAQPQPRRAQDRRLHGLRQRGRELAEPVVGRLDQLARRARPASSRAGRAIAGTACARPARCARRCAARWRDGRRTASILRRGAGTRAQLGAAWPYPVSPRGKRLPILRCKAGQLRSYTIILRGMPRTSGR